MNTVTMIDTIGADVPSIPTGTPIVAGYVTGSGDVVWPSSAWAQFPHSGHLRIDQSPQGIDFGAGRADAYDMETNAGTAHQFAQLVAERIHRGIEWSTAYGTDSTLAEVRAALDAAGPGGWYAGHVDCWLADWNLTEAEAAAVVGTQVHGMTCRAVQWASPTSNPDTPIPGGHVTLKAGNVDLSVAEEGWHTTAAPPPPPPPPAPGPELEAILVQLPAGTSRKVLSADGGKTWR